MNSNQVNNQPDHPEDYCYFHVSYLRKCLWGNIWKCNNLILNTTKTKQRAEYIIEHEQTQMLTQEGCLRQESFCFALCLVLGNSVSWSLTWRLVSCWFCWEKALVFPKSWCCNTCTLRPEGWLIVKVTLSSVTFATASEVCLVELRLTLTENFPSVQRFWMSNYPASCPSNAPLHQHVLWEGRAGNLSTTVVL